MGAVPVILALYAGALCSSAMSMREHACTLSCTATCTASCTLTGTLNAAL